MRGSMIPASLRYTHQVARSGSIQAAAKELNIAASAINRQILGLEEDLGVALFERMPRGMRLTAAGHALVTLIRHWREDETGLAAEIRQLQGTSQGKVSLMAMDGHVNGVLLDFVQKLADSHPRISLDVEVASPDDALTALLAGKVEIAAIANLAPRREIHTLWRVDLPFGCVVARGHALAGRDSISLQEAVAYPIVLQSAALPIRRYLDSHHAWLFTDERKTITTNSPQFVKMLAKSGDYLAFTSQLDAAPELIEGSLVFLPVRDKGAEPQSISVAIDARKPLSRVARIVADLLTENLQGFLARAQAAGERTQDV